MELDLRSLMNSWPSFVDTMKPDTRDKYQYPVVKGRWYAACFLFVFPYHASTVCKTAQREQEIQGAGKELRSSKVTNVVVLPFFTACVFIQRVRRNNTVNLYVLR